MTEMLLCEAACIRTLLGPAEWTEKMIKHEREGTLKGNVFESERTREALVTGGLREESDVSPS